MENVLISTGTYILTDSLYVEYGGWTGTSTFSQRNIAYMIAEDDVMSHIGTRLIPEYITGTYNLPLPNSSISLGHSRVTEIVSVRFKSADPDDSDVYVSGTDVPVTAVTNPDYGYVGYDALVYIVNDGLNCACLGNNLSGLDIPIQLEIVYKAGLPVGMGTHPNIILALTMAAGNILKEMVDPGALESGAGDAAIEEFSIQGYREKRKKQVSTVFGASPVASRIRRLLSKYSKKPGLKLGR